ncbi:hypothetical protein G6N05_02600 [Flavobacterium sp. F372]|uniref:Carboxypeptidase regulatory-like domain-containing protein n=1 Tax=Flavobacterium bernardetii TaxID=2813823 RepID=A0ABR7IVH9_9FLAO|nr:hypothetical protein [Flavobacterium bernardetii]MBC5833767.1 hypothetical protein [Flavobacterium bernardetii]NHF69000.1 hypothetical protein [Flavobacterium bernardetii]
MKSKIQISIPEPCNEGWQNMTPVEKGRFCASCQKTVLDFTYLSDNEIINLVNKNDTLCGRINTSQLNRNLIETKRTSNYFGYFATSVLAFLGLGTSTIVAQEKPLVVQNNSKSSTDFDEREFLVRGIVKDTLGNGIGNIFIHIRNQKPVLTDLKGEFEICVRKNQRIFILNDANEEYNDFECKISDNNFLEIVLENSAIIHRSSCTTGLIYKVSATTIIKKRTFLGRTFHKIGNWFR